MWRVHCRLPKMIAPQSLQQRRRIVGLFTDLLGIGGVQETGRLTSKALADIAHARGWSIDLISLNDPTGTHALPGCEPEIRFRGFARNKSQFVLAALRQAWRMERHGIVLAAHPHLGPPAAWMRWVRPSLQTIVMCHGVDVWKPLTGQRRKALHGASRVVVPSSDTERRLTNVQGIPSSKVRRLPPPLGTNFMRMASEPQALPLPSRFPRGRIVLTVGRWSAAERYKGADDLIRAVAYLRSTIPDIQLVAVGSGDDLPRLRTIATELKVEDRVHFLENLANEEVAACYANCDLFALPSTGEGYGLVFLEAMAFGKPVLGAACGGATDIVRHGVNGILVPPGDFERLRQTLEQLLGDESLRARLGRAGTEVVNREYHFGAFRARIEVILSECTAAGGRT